MIADLFAGARTPAHLTTVEFAAAAAAALSPAGIFAANLGDGPPLTHARARVATVRAVFPHACLIADPAVLRGRRFGNLVLAASGAELPVAALARRTAGDPFPGRVVGGAELDRFAAGARPVVDGNAAGFTRPAAGPLRRQAVNSAATSPSGSLATATTSPAATHWVWTREPRRIDVPGQQGRAPGRAAVGQPAQHVERIAHDVGTGPVAHVGAVDGHRPGDLAEGARVERLQLRAEHARVVEEIVGDQRRGAQRRVVGVAVLHHLDRGHARRHRAGHVSRLVRQPEAGQVPGHPHGDLAFHAEAAGARAPGRRARRATRSPGTWRRRKDCRCRGTPA